jgi:hypothetical protein
MLTQLNPTNVPLNRSILGQNPIFNDPAKECVGLPKSGSTILFDINNLDLERLRERLRPRC